MSYRERLIREHAERLREGVYDGEPDAVAPFAEYLAEQGSLGHGVVEIKANMTVADLVDAYLKTRSAQLELSAWAKIVAEEAQEDAEMRMVG
ncbi:hypothetical protein MHM84_01070 [Halomonas sp. McH1-25]|uniref:hypothetical protein n=1 Tax=unclassified Halomonas TaxID=2609666 RepID=UPI001EF3FE64|nr:MULTISPECIES: hypothetical protein [unclassified Halomonas]MCG7598372.1 hypothetical protein [Halomonas sp. McH1-25]MCP1342686.1 hypothetical protein [Halomonas sp. FL8]MCP1363086.1 hypothetical protein [Halomonas sp. BBD45]MCP1365573.1 hypothetical protein [Halomonas sp. BBD48]